MADHLELCHWSVGQGADRRFVVRRAGSPLRWRRFRAATGWVAVGGVRLCKAVPTVGRQATRTEAEQQRLWQQEDAEEDMDGGFAAFAEGSGEDEMEDGVGTLDSNARH